jgi:hypothetical protein
MRLGEALRLFLSRIQRNRQGEIVQSINAFFQKTGGEAKKVRKNIEAKECIAKCITDFTTFKTYCRLVDTDPDAFLFKNKVFGYWNNNFITNKMRDFWYRYTNNQLPLNIRLSHYAQNVPRTCQLCLISNAGALNDESFKHLFLECHVTATIQDWFIRKYIRNDAYDVQEKKGCFLSALSPISLISTIFWPCLLL